MFSAMTPRYIRPADNRAIPTIPPNNPRTMRRGMAFTISIVTSLHAVITSVMPLPISAANFGLIIDPTFFEKSRIVRT